MADYTGYIVAILGVVDGDQTRVGAVWPISEVIYGRPNRDVGTATITLGAATASAAGAVIVDGDASIALGSATLSSAGIVASAAVTGQLAVTLGAATLSSSGTVASPAIAGQLAVTLGALSVASAGTVAEFVPSRERTKRVPSWPRVLLAENPDRVIELYRPPRTVRTAA